MKRAMRRRALSRRRFLTGLGGVTVGLPWLERLNGTASAQSAANACVEAFAREWRIRNPG